MGAHPDLAASCSQVNPAGATVTIGDLYHAHARFVWRRLQQMGVREAELEDAMQEVFVVAYRALADFDPRRAQPSTWLFGICLNVARNYTRSQRRRDARLDPDAHDVTGTTWETPEELLEWRHRRLLLEVLLAEMPIEQRATWVLFEIEGLSGQEIAAQMQVPVGTVHSRLYHARRRLMEGFAERFQRCPGKGEVLP